MKTVMDAVNELKGEVDTDDEYSCIVGVGECIKNCDDEGHIVGQLKEIGSGYDGDYFVCICTIEEFNQCVAELSEWQPTIKEVSMIKVSDAQLNGIQFAEGDVVGDLTLTKESALTMNTLTLGQSLVVTEFAPRQNTGVQPVGDDVVVHILISGVWDTVMAGGMNWDIVEDEDLTKDVIITHWKPSLKWLTEQVNKIQTETPEEKLALDAIQDKQEDEMMARACVKPESPVSAKMWKAMTDATNKAYDKPIFTQAQSDAGELPIVGAEFATNINQDIPMACLYSSKFCVIGLIGSSGIECVFNLHLPDIDYKFKPIKTEREKAIDNSLMAIGAHPSQEFIQGAPLVIGKLFDAGLLK